jgi:hypothetical protein
MLLATKLAERKNPLGRIFAALILIVAVYVLFRSQGVLGPNS